MKKITLYIFMVALATQAMAFTTFGHQTIASIANKHLTENFVSRDIEKLVKIEDGDLTSSTLTAGNQIIGGSALVIASALENYKRIYHSMEEGGATAHELNMTLVDGAAISPEIIDNALDKKLELAYKCNRPVAEVTQKELSDLAGSLNQSDLPRAELIAHITANLLPFLQNTADDSWLEDYRRHSCILGKEILRIENGISKPCVAEEIDHRGRLVVRYPDGSLEVLQSGEISIRPR